MRRITALLALLALLLTMLPATALATPRAQLDTSGERIAGSWIVELRTDVDPSSAAPTLARQYSGRVGFVYAHALNGFSFKGSDSAATALARDPRVASVVADRPVHAVDDTIPTGVSRIDASNPDQLDAHEKGHTGSGMNIAILDTGIDLDHPDLRVAGSAMWRNCIDPSKTPDDGHGHGTHVAGTAAAMDNGSGVIGVAHAATVVPVKVLSDSGSGSWESVICGVDHVTALNTDSSSSNDIAVANMSLGGTGSANGCSEGLHKAICTSVNAGVVYAVAAGNDSDDASNYVPAAYPEVITVSAYQDLDGQETDSGCTGFPFTTCDEEFASFSNFGTIVDVIAPGARIYSSDKDGKYSTKSGTSMAAPHVAGVVALVRAANANLTPAEVKSLLKASGQCPNHAQNDGDLVCDGTWAGDPDGVTEPMVNALWAAQAAAGGGGGGSDPANTPPVANDVSATTNEDVAVIIELSGSDAETCELTFSIVIHPTKGSLGDIGNLACTPGTLNIDTATVTYTPNLNYNGGDSFTYRVSDGNATDDGSVSVTINPVNDPPVAVDDAYGTPTNTALIVKAPGVLTNDTDVDGDVLSAVAASALTSQGGSYNLASDGSFTYTPGTDFTGTDTFTYTVSDPSGTSDTGTVSITVGSLITVESLTDLGSVNNGSTWTARVRVTITDSSGNPVEGATVNGSWTYNGTTTPDGCNTKTNASGQCEIELSGIRKNVSSAKITITGVTHSQTWDGVEKSLTVFKP